MSEIDRIAAEVVVPFAASAKTSRVVADAFRLVVAPEEKYDESTVAIEKLEFASYAVGGLSATATNPPAGQARPASHIEIPLADSAGGTGSAGLDVTLYGPGDVRGIDAEQIVRRYPAPGTANAEETVLAHVEFDRPELPWAFTGAAPAAALRPWLALVVLERSAVQWEPATGLLPVLRVSATQLPPLANAHLWAHAQAAQSATGASLEVRLSPEYAPVNLSRLVSPRVLTQDTDYLAALVPTTDAGVKGGLGGVGGTLDPAWNAGADVEVRLPVYDSWEFRTGPDGDFATLALRLDGVVAPYEVGRRFIDASQPGKPLPPLPGDEGAKQVLRCALYSTTPPPPEKAAAETATWPQSEVDELREVLDRPAEIEGSEKRTDGIPNLPIVGPRIYAALHRGSPVITGDDWFAEVNLAPTKRIVAGLGTRVVQRDQEQLMQSAWAQLGEVEKANRAIRLAQLAELLAQRLHDRIANLDVGRLVQVAAPLATRVTLNPGRTLAADIAASATPMAAVSGAFRRTVRPGGPVLRRADAASRARAGDLVGTQGALRDFTRTYRNPDGIGTLSAPAIGLLDRALVSQAIGMPEPEVPDVLERASGQVQGGVVAYLMAPAQWKAPSAGFDLGATITQRWRDEMLRESTVPAAKTIRAQRVGPLFAQLATSSVVDRIGMREQFETEAMTFNNAVADAIGAPATPATPEAPDGPPIKVEQGPKRHGGVLIFPDVKGRGDGERLDPHVIVRGGVGEGIGLQRGGIAASPLAGAVGRIRGVAGRGQLGFEQQDDAQILIGAGRVPVASPRPVRIPGRIAGTRQLDPDAFVRITSDTPEEDRITLIRDFGGIADVQVAPVLERFTELPVDRLRASMVSLVDPSGVLAIAPVPRANTLVADQLVTKLDPAVTVRAALDGRLKLSPALADKWASQRFFVPIMAAPHFDRPMYQALHDDNPDWLVPGLGLLPATDFVTVLSTNPEFMEAFFVGLSDEMGRELLWRGYPTDQRGTYFRRFWDAAQDELTTGIHAFSHKPLGQHVSIGGTGGSDPRAVIVVKSDLVRRYPDMIVQAIKSQSADVLHPVFERPDGSQEVAEQLFAAYLEPDIALIGVDLSVEELDRSTDWWIVVAEHPSATRFGRPLDAQIPAGQVFLPASAPSGAEFAKQRLHDPVRVAFQATDLIVT